MALSKLIIEVDFAEALTEAVVDGLKADIGRGLIVEMVDATQRSHLEIKVVTSSGEVVYLQARLHTPES